VNVDLYKNGELMLICNQTDPIEREFLKQMKLRVDSGRPVRFRETESGIVIAVEK
jgi:hypothetical protein